jgi:hypothetical protein
MWMPGKSCKVIIGHIVPKVVEQQEWIKLRRVAQPKRAAHMHASAFERWFGFDEALDRAYRHSCSPVSGSSLEERRFASHIEYLFRLLVQQTLSCL